MCPHVQRFEQVCLPGAVGPRNERQTGLQRKLETRVRANVAQRDRLDDQPKASLCRLPPASRVALPGETDGHDQVPEIVALGGDQPRTER